MIDYEEKLYKELLDEIIDAKKKGKLAILANYRRKFKFKEEWIVIFKKMFLTLSQDKEITGTDHRVLDYILANIGLENRINMTQAEIAEELEMKRQHVSRSIKKLIMKDYLNEIIFRGRKRLKLNINFAWKGSAEAYEEAKKNM